MTNYLILVGDVPHSPMVYQVEFQTVVHEDKFNDHFVTNSTD